MFHKKGGERAQTRIVGLQKSIRMVGLHKPVTRATGYEGVI